MRITDFLMEDIKIEETELSTCDFFKDAGKDLLFDSINEELTDNFDLPVLSSDSAWSQVNDNDITGCDYLKELQDGIDLETSFLSDGSLDTSSPVSLVQETIPAYSSAESCSSGSDISPLDMWGFKETETPPISPTSVKLSPSTSPTPYYVLAGECLTFVQQVPVSSTESTRNKKTVRQLSTFSGTKVKIKPRLIDPPLHESSDQTNGMNSSWQRLKKSELSKTELMKLQAQRKHERMIRNRESACLSRKKRKEYVTQLEDRVKELTLENTSLRMENKHLKERLNMFEDSNSLYLTKRDKRNIFVGSTKKTTALLALVIMVCLNVGSLSLLNEKSDSTSYDKIVPISAQAPKYGGRSLLWSVDTDIMNVTNNRSVPPTADTTAATCPMYINQSESIRLESELRRWIGAEENYTATTSNNNNNNNNFHHGFDSLKISDLFHSDNQMKKSTKMRKRFKKQQDKTAFVNEMDIYNNLFNLDSFFEAIHRRDDTFYVVSFSGDHLLLPALAHNKTHRPKMSLMLPAFHFNSTTESWSDEVKMMRIDCEVTNTNLFHVHENDIPQYMRQTGNSTKSQQDYFEEKDNKQQERNNKTLTAGYTNMSLAQVLFDRTNGTKTYPSVNVKNKFFTKQYNNLTKF